MKPFALTFISIAIATASPVLAQEQEEWARAALPSDFASIETPCKTGDEEMMSRGQSEAMRCMVGPYEIGFALSGGAAFGVDGSDGAVFDAILARTHPEGRVEFEIDGRRALRAEEQGPGRSMASAMIEIGPEQIMIFMVRPISDGADNTRLPDLLDRALGSLVFHSEDVSQ